MKTTEEILTEMIMKNKNKIEEDEKKYNENITNLTTWYVDLRNKMFELNKQETEIIEKLVKKVKKITLILSISIILNTISIIILNLWR